MRNVLSFTAVLGLSAILLGSASAQTRPNDSTHASRAGWMSVSAIVTKLEGQGYTVREIELDDGVYEVKAIDRNGARVEADLDPSTGEPRGRWHQDD
ncbi:MAG: PepSY domain-containing protein [Pseudorhodoplanes sp.]